MPLSQANNRLYTRSSQLVGQNAAGLTISALNDLSETIADADLLLIDNGGDGGTNVKFAASRIPTYVFTKVSGAITINSSGVASLGTNAEGTNLTLSGNLTVNGATTNVSSTTVTIDDPLFALADNNSADTVDIGWYGKYVDSGTKYSGLFRDASDSDMWKLFSTTGNSNAAPSTTVDTTSGFALANLSVNELTGTIATAAQGNITSLGTLSALTVDDVAVDGKVVTMTGSSGDTATLTVGTNGTLDITTTDTAAAAANIQITADGTAELAGTTVTLDSEGGITLDANGGTITFADNGSSLGTITSSGYSGTAAIATTVTITDNESTDEDNAVVFTAGGDVDGGNLGLESDGNLTYNPSSGTLSSTAFSGNLTGNVTGTASIATLATTVTITDNESTDEDNAIVFTAGGDVDGGNLGLESDGTLTYNPSSGTLTSTTFAGNLTGNASGSAATVTTAAQTNITSLGTLTGLTIDGNKSVTPGDGAMFHIDTSTITDNNTSSSGTAALYSNARFEGPTLAASNSSVTTTAAATVYINAAPSAGTNQTLTNAYALFVDAGDVRFDGNIIMGSNTAGNLLIADGSNFSSTAVGDLSEISSVASDDVFLAIDTSGGGLKKITRSTLVSGLATSSGIANIAEDSTPQLGGDLDVNSNDIVSTSNGNINLLPNGSGKVIMDGNGSSGGITISDGTIDIRTGTGAVAKLLFYCEVSNAHAQTVQAQPHSAGVTNTLTLPAGGNGELVSTVATQTLTNKSLGSDLNIFEDANNADVKLTMGTSATESLTIQVLNGGSNKTAESVSFATATASSTGDHGKFTFNVDGTDIFDVDDSGINLASGKTFRINGTTIDGDITSVVAGTGLTGGGTDGDVTLNVAAGNLIDVQADQVDVDLTEAGEAAIANGDYILFLDGGATGSHAKENIADVATLFAGTGLTASSSVIAVDSSQAITALTGGDLTIYEDANNADVSLKMGTSATEALSIEVLNGDSNKTAESVTFSTATASSTSDHGKFTFNVDGTDIFDVDDSGINLASGKSFRINGTTIDGDITGVTAGNGLSGGGTDGAISLALDLSELTDTAIANGDYIVFTDTTDSNATVKGDLADVATLFAGTGLTASSSVIGVDASQTQITAVGTIATGTWEATDIAVAHGGTGASSLSANAILTGNGTSAIQAETDLLFSSNKLIPTATAHNAAGTALTMSAGATTAGTTNNIAGGALTFQGGQGKGSGAGGDIIFQTANAGGSGSSLNSLATALTLSDDLSATFGGAVVVGGDLTVNGTTTTVNSTTTTVDDPIMTLGGDSAPGSDDNKDRGIEFRWHDGSSAKLGFFGFDDSTGRLSFIPDASNSSEVFSGTKGDIDVTNVYGTVATASQGSITTLAGLTTIGTVSNALAMTYSDVTLFHDANNADTSFSIGTSATEALKIEVLNGGSNKTAEEVHFSTATASGTADHGKMVFDIDGSDILTIDDGGLVVKTTGTIGPVGDEDLVTLTASGSLVTVAGELSVTTLDIGGTNVTSTAAEINILDDATVTTAELNLLDGDTSVGGSITLADGDGVVVNDGGTMKTIPASDVKTYASGDSATKGFAIAMAVAL